MWEVANLEARFFFWAKVAIIVNMITKYANGRRKKVVNIYNCNDTWYEKQRIYP